MMSLHRPYPFAALAVCRSPRWPSMAGASVPPWTWWESNDPRVRRSEAEQIVKQKLLEPMKTN